MIPVTKTSLPPFGEYCAEIRKCWDSHILTNMGEEHEAFRAALEAFLPCPHVSLFTNGHLALEAALAALDLPPGGEVITTPYTFVSTTHAIARKGLVPVFCDVRAEDATMDPSCIEALITDKTVAILPVHVYGHVCDADAIGEIAARHGLKLLYDAAHAFGVRYRGVPAVSFGDASVLSFHATKVFSTIEGGAVCSTDGRIAAFLDDEKNFGIRGPESCVSAGGNAKMSEFQAAMGLCNLRHFDEVLEKRKVLTERYLSRLEGRVRILSPREGVTPNYAYMPVLMPGRDAAFQRLAAQGIAARKYFYPLTSAVPCYAPSAAQTPMAASLAEQVLCLPLYPDLPPEEVDWICAVLTGEK